LSILASLEKKWGIKPDPECALCVILDRHLATAAAEVLELRIALADGEPTRSARRDLEVVNARLAEANAQLARHKGNGS
jgi:hypothetical protein